MDVRRISLTSPKAEPPQFVNDYKKMYKVVDPNPTVIMACALKDLLLLLTIHKPKGAKMFAAVGESEHFVVVERQAAVLRSAHIFSRDKKMEPVGANYWLQADDQLLSFFINMHNFLILFSLCKTKGRIPKNLAEWIAYSNSVAIKVGPFVFTALEIQHAVLRAGMGVPKIFATSGDLLQLFPRFDPSDPRFHFRYDKKEPLIDFVLYFPCK